PFGDVHIVIGQECLNSPAQQRWVVARHRRNDQQFWLRPPRRPRKGALEMQEPAERTLPNALDVHRDSLGAYGCRIDIPFGPTIAAGRALEQFHGRRHRLAVGSMGKRISRIPKEQSCGVCKSASWIERGMPQLVKPVHRRRQQRPTAVGERGCSAEFTYCHRVPRPSMQCGRLSLFRHIVNIEISCSRRFYNAHGGIKHHKTQAFLITRWSVKAIPGPAHSVEALKRPMMQPRTAKY